MASADPKDEKTLKAETAAVLAEPREARASAANKTHTLQVAALVGGFFVILNIAFFFLSMLYFNDKKANPLAGPIDNVNDVRIAFAVFSGVVSAMAVVVTMSPKWVSHGIAGIAGVFAMIAAIGSLAKGMPVVLPAALFWIGVLMPLLAWRSLVRSRAAWSFLIAICGVLALVLLFGAPKIRGQLHVGLWTALILPGLLGVATVGLTMLRGDYREHV